MCGIAGIWQSRSAGAEARLAAMLDAIAHRGPDGRGTLAYPGGAAGMVRLALVDLSEHGQQPMWSPDGKVAILFNGELYDFREHRARLDYRFASSTDTEVALALYLEHGESFVRHLRGMYAIAILDRRGRSDDAPPDLLLLRDPFGIKPLYLAESGDGSVAFASELRALRAGGAIDGRISSAGLDSFLRRGFVVQPRTIYEGAEMLPRGTLVRWRPGAPRHAERYWLVPPYQPVQESRADAARRLRGALDESIRLHSFADAPVGAFLSGGVDSAGIVALMREHVRSLRTYTLRIRDVDGADESAEAEAAARRFGTVHTTVDVDGAIVADALPAFARALDQPSNDGLNTWLISRAAAKDVKGVLSGLGGDEWFAGYPVTRRMARRSNSLRGAGIGAVGSLARWFEPLLSEGPARRRVRNLGARASALALWSQAHTLFAPNELGALTGRSTGGPEDDLVALLDGLPWRDESGVGLSLLLDVRAYMACQLLRDSDATSMAHSLELRVPFVDLRVAEFSRSCADEHKLSANGGVGSRYRESGAKRVLIDALADVLPLEIADRQKRGFALPVPAWLRGPLAPLFDDLLSPDTLRRRGLVDPALGAAAWRSFRAGGEDWVKPWSLGILEMWMRA
jgi:asparagine synthase (glutamine-hydrolysing)